jgi:hypothetical protein
VWTTEWYRPRSTYTTQRLGQGKVKLDARREGEPSPFSTVGTSGRYGLQGEHSLVISGTSKLPPELSRKVQSQHVTSFAYVREDKARPVTPALNTIWDGLVVLPNTTKLIEKLPGILHVKLLCTLYAKLQLNSSFISILKIRAYVGMNRPF